MFSEELFDLDTEILHLVKNDKFKENFQVTTVLNPLVRFLP